METPVQIEFRDIAHSQALETLIRAKAAKLETIFARLMRCHVSIGQAHRHKRRGNPFSVRIVLHVPGGELVVNRDHDEDVHVALRDAFNAVRQQPEEHAQKVHREVKHQTAGLRGSGPQHRAPQ